MNTQLKSHVCRAGAAALFALTAIGMTMPVQAAQQEKPGRCFGINTCKGTSVCATAKSDCKGLNECKGEGVLVKTPTECKALGGTLTEKE